MPDVAQSLLLGRPQFHDPTLAAHAREQGVASAWLRALAGGPKDAAAGVDGSFAVALRDTAGRSFAAVDRFATHALAYRVDADGLHFAERADALAGPGGADIDPQALFDYLHFHVSPSPRTVFGNVRRLPPGHFAWFENGTLSVAPYWIPEFDDRAAFSLGREKPGFLRLLRGAVAGQLDGSKPACYLSGGTDSSTVAGMLTQVADRRPATYSIGFEAVGYDEMSYARIAATHFGTEHHEYYVTPDDLVAAIPLVAGHYDQPFGNSSALPAYCCARMARDDGVTRLLAGDGGDELFGGNTRYATQRLLAWYEGLPAPLRSAVLEPFFGLSAVARAPLLRKGSGYIRHARLPMPERMHGFNLLRRTGTTEVLTEAFLRQVDLADADRQQRAVWETPRTADLVNRMLAYDWRYTLAETDLPKVTGTARLAGVDVGFPLLDASLLALSLRLPPAAKLKGLKLRWFFKEALRGFLPDAILAKQKHGFGLPFGPWLTRHDRLRALAADALGSLGTRGIVRPEFIRRLLAELLPAQPGYYGEMVWILVMLEHWLRRHAPDFAQAQ